MATMSDNWPTADLNPVRRLQVLAAATPGAVYGEHLVPHPFATVWAVVADMDREIPNLLPNYRSWRTTRIDGDHRVAAATGYLGLRGRFDVVLRDGWCLMQDARVIGGMAATPTGGGTRFAIFAAPRSRARHLIRPLAGPLGRRMGHRVGARLAARARDRAAGAR
jgi:hypothetical protein